ncbi:MAG: hypothetical protein LBI77_01175 [Puniceicoccales bacterium]|jgi:hypothetical protein|nr:hypothetical protein [Puniceicoccales bacterium]
MLEVGFAGKEISFVNGGKITSATNGGVFGVELVMLGGGSATNGRCLGVELVMLEVGFAGKEISFVNGGEITFAADRGGFGGSFTALGGGFAGRVILLGLKARGCVFFLSLLDLRDFFTVCLFFDPRDFGFTAFGRSFAGKVILLGLKARGCVFFLSLLDLRDFFTACLFFDSRDFFVLRSFFNPNCLPWDFLLIFLGPE